MHPCLMNYGMFFLLQGKGRGELGWGGGGCWVNFCWVCALASQSPCPIIVYSVANYTSHLSHFWANV